MFMQNSKKCVFSLARNVDSELVLRMSFCSEFQMFGAATQNTCLAVSVRVHGTERCEASVDHKDCVITCVTPLQHSHFDTVLQTLL